MQNIRQIVVKRVLLRKGEYFHVQSSNFSNCFPDFKHNKCSNFISMLRQALNWRRRDKKSKIMGTRYKY
jgi:hypothetical protein